MLVVQYQAKLKIGSHTHLREIWIVIAFGFWQWAAMRGYVAIGGSGGPVFNTKGEVIGVNSAYMDGFAGGTIGVSVDSLRPLLQEAQKQNQ